MASTVNEIIKESLERLRKKSLSLTPDNYSKIFCEVARERKVVVEDCRKVDNALKKVDSSLQEEAKKHKINDVDDLLKFFTAVIKRSNTAENKKTLQSFLLLSKRLLQTITMLHDKEAASLANTSLQRLETNSQPQTIELIRDKWLDFMSSYDDAYLDKLGQFGVHDTDDLKRMVKDICTILKQGNTSDIYADISSLIIYTLTPSIASSMDDELANISYELRQKPELISTKQTQEDIKKFISKRIELDKNEISERISSLNKILEDINKKIIDLVNTGESHTKSVVSIREDLQAINISKDDFENIQSKLITIASSLESETQSLTTHIKKDKETIENLQDRIGKLEIALVKAKKESKEDFLTHVATKRALQSQLERTEEAFRRYQINYSVCFFDIDNFKNINDTYGHEAGDVILATLGKILNKYVRKVDFVGRYGGEEFLVILPNIELENAVKFAEKIRHIIENFKFIYKKDRINVTVSGGLSERSQQSSLDETVENADKELYKSKENGRNQISPKQ